MSRRVFIHVGTPKSGTTYLQDRLALNRDVLAAQGLTYIDTRTGDHFEAALDLIQERWAGQVEVASGQWDALIHEVDRTHGDVLISHEILGAASPAQVEKAMQDLIGCEVHIVLTARDLARQVPAEWQEEIKHRGKKSFRRFYRDVREADRTNPTLWFWRVQSVPDIITRWGNGLPPDRVHVVTVPPPGAPRDTLWRRFVDVIGIDPEVDYADSDNVNASLGIVEAKVLRRLNRLLAGQGLPRDVYVEVVRDLIGREVLGHREKQIPAVLSGGRLRFAREVAREWHDWLEGSEVRIVGDLADLVPARADAEGYDPDEPPEELVAEAAIEALASLVLHSAQSRDWSVRRLARRLRRS